MSTFKRPHGLVHRAAPKAPPPKKPNAGDSLYLNPVHWGRWAMLAYKNEARDKRFERKYGSGVVQDPAAGYAKLQLIRTLFPEADDTRVAQLSTDYDTAELLKMAPAGRARSASPAEKFFALYGAGVMPRELSTYGGYLDSEKYQDYVGSYDLDFTWRIKQCVLVPCGTGVSQRVQQKIVIGSIGIRGYAVAHATSGWEQGFRAIIVYDRHPNGVQPSISSILQTTDWWSLANVGTTERFVLLYDLMDTVGGQEGSSRGGSKYIRLFNWYRSTALPVHYNANCFGDIRDIEVGALYIAWVGTLGPGLQAGFFGWHMRLRFFDADCANR